MSDSFVQVQPDGPGKQLDTEQVGTLAGSTIYTQRARLVGDSQDIIQQLLSINLAQLAALRAINANLKLLGGQADEDDYTSDLRDLG